MLLRRVLEAGRSRHLAARPLMAASTSSSFSWRRAASSSSVPQQDPSTSPRQSDSNPALAADAEQAGDESSSVLVERRPIPGHNAGYLVVTLNRPQKSNAMDMELLHDLQGVFDSLPGDKWVRCVVLAGAGKSFSCGHDLYQMHNAQGNKAIYERMFARCSRFMLSIQRVPQPVIAAVNGLATGAGCQLVAACDLAIASDRAQFGTSGVKLGLFCATPSVPLSRNIGRKRALEMLFTGNFVDAARAKEWGLVNHVVPHDELEEAVQKLVLDISDKPAVAISMGKRFFYQQLEKQLPAAYDLADFTMSANMVARDTEEGIAAFVEKRQPDWDL